MKTRPVFSSDTVLTVHVDDEQVARDDDGGRDGGSLITYTSDTTGQHIVEIVPWQRSVLPESSFVEGVGPAYAFRFSVDEIAVENDGEAGASEDDLAILEEENAFVRGFIAGARRDAG